MSTMPEVLSEAVDAVLPVVRGAGDADPTTRTPCQDWSLADLTGHALGTTAGLARLGRRQPLDPDDPWGAPASDRPWADQLADQLRDLAEAWSPDSAWEGEVELSGQSMPAPMIGDMVLAEVVLHGWDLAGATRQPLRFSDRVAAQLWRGIESTAEMGRQMGAYGAAVPVAEDASDLDRALGAAGRDPGWPS